MNSKTRKITTSALMAAISVIFLYIASVIPTGQIGFIALASLAGIAAVIEGGISGGIAVFVCASALGFLIVPNKNPVYVYMLFFGYYPVLKSIAEKRKSRVLEWIIKIVIFNIAIYIILVLLSLLVMNSFISKLSLPVLMAALNVVFVVFDIGITKVVFLYIKNISRRMKK